MHIYLTELVLLDLHDKFYTFMKIFSVNISGVTAGESNICSEGVTLAPRSTEKVTLVSNGRLPQGFCEVTVVINNSGRCKREICIQGAGTLDNSGLKFDLTPSPGNNKKQVL
jgi:hypothetical protein